MLFHSKTTTFQFPKSLRSPRFQLLIWVLDLQLLRQPFWGRGQPVRLSSSKASPVGCSPPCRALDILRTAFCEMISLGTMGSHLNKKSNARPSSLYTLYPSNHKRGNLLLPFPPLSSVPFRGGPSQKKTNATKLQATLWQLESLDLSNEGRCPNS